MTNLDNLPDRMMVWFTPQLLMSTEMILQRLESLAAEYDKGAEAGTMTVGEMDKIFAKSDKLQAELWRRFVQELAGHG